MKNKHLSSMDYIHSGNQYIRNSIWIFCVYSALLFIIIFSGCKTTFKPMDINGEGRFDKNLFLQNPNWQFRLVNRASPDQTTLCPVTSDNPQDWIKSSTCTSQNVYINKATGWNLFICNFEPSSISGHMNWFPVEYDGSLYWSDKSSNDDDYNFKMCRTDSALYTGKNGYLALEFDSDETVDHWDGTGTWWESFHHELNNDERNGSILADKKFAIVMGLIGLDGGHSDFSAELHPVYGMFIHTKDNPTDDRWAFFIRNWGDEGYCSNNQEYLYRNTIQVIIPHDNTDDVDLTASTHISATNFDPSMTVSFEHVKEGTLFTFTFNDPQNKGCFVGDLGLVWKGSNLAPRNDFNQNPINPNNSSSPSSSASALEETEFHDPVFNRINQLDNASRKQLNDLLDGSVVSEQFPLPSKPKVTLIDNVLKSHINLDSIQTKISQLKRTKKLPNYREFVRPTPDSATFIRKKMRQDLILNFLKSKGIK